MSALRDRFLETGYAIKLLIHPFNLFPVDHDPEQTSRSCATIEMNTHLA